MMPAAPILILFANLKGNLGDFAILHAMLLELEKRYPGQEKHVVSHGQHDVDEARLQAFRTHAHPAFIYKGKAPFRRVPKALSLFKRIGLARWLSAKLIDRYQAEFSSEHPISGAAEYGAVFFAGGEQWSGFSNGITQFAACRAISDRNPEVFIFPFSVKRKILETYPREVLAGCFSRFSGKLVTRDSHSEEIIRSLCPTVSANGADCVFSLAGMAENLPATAPVDEKLVIIAVTEGDGSRYADLLEMTARLLEGGYRVRLLTTCEREDARDMRMLSQALQVEYLAPASWQEVVGEFRSAAMVVTNRLHCMIFTFFAGVPLVPLLNREKVVGVFNDAELPHSINRAQDLTPAKVAECSDASALILHKMRLYMEKVSQADLNP